MAYFPLFVNMEEKQVLVVGGGAIAERRVKTLLEFGCKITVVSPKVTDELKGLDERGRIRWIQAEYRAEHLNHCQRGSGLGEMQRNAEWIFVLSAAEAEVNKSVVTDCRHAKIPVNNASRKEDCDFYFPGLIKEEQIVIGITSGGSDHKAVASLSKKIRALVQKT